MAIQDENKIFEQGKINIKDLLAPAGLKINDNCLQIGEKYARVIFVFTFPRYLYTGWFAPIITLDREMNISLYIHPVDTVNMLNQLRKKVAEVQAQIFEAEEKGLVRDPMLEASLKNMENLRDMLQQGTEKFFRFGIYVTIFGSSIKELDETENLIRTNLEQKLVYMKPASFQQEQGFLSTLPLNQDILDITTPLNSSPISSLFPFISLNLTSNKGILYGINKYNNSLIIFDRFSLENYNMVIFAKSGAGKSYTVKLELLRSLMFDTEVLIIDPENEYQYLTEMVGGTFIKVSLTSPHHINPFDLPPPRPDENPGDILRSQILNLAGLLRVMLKGLTPEEENILDKAITETYAARDITPESDFSKATPPLLSDLQTVLKNMKGAESLAVRMDKFTTGSYANFFNQYTNVEVKNKLVTFSIRDLEEELRPLAMFIILNFIWTLVRAELKKRILVVDEAWTLMRQKDGAEFMLNIAKRARKYYLGLTTITQDIPDLLQSEYGQPIINNSSLQFLLKQSTATIDIVQKTFNLTDQEKYLLLESSVGEGLFFAGLKHVAIKIWASYTEDQIITSDPKQILEIEKAKKELSEEGA